jgi:release factor glutamine methyltransferase
LLEGDLLETLPEPVNIIVANLPYVREEELKRLAPEIRWFEPLLALDGGEDGLDKVRQFLSQSGDRLIPPGIILLEVGLGQAQEVKTIAEGYFSSLSIDVIPDLSGIDRVVRVGAVCSRRL